MSVPNVLLVVLDGVRAANTFQANHVRETMPNLEGFADGATVYECAYAPSNWSLPSHTSIFTGLAVPEHEITVQYERLRPGYTIWEQLRDEYGYETGLFSQNEFLTAERYGLDHGFETVVGPISPRTYPFSNARKPAGPMTAIEDAPGLFELDAHGRKPVRTAVNYLYGDVRKLLRRLQRNLAWAHSVVPTDGYRSPARFHIDRFLEWETSQDGPWGACLNLMDANLLHVPWPDRDRWSGPYQRKVLAELSDVRWDFYSGRQPWWKLRALEPRYDAGIHRVDAELNRLLQTLQRRDVLRETLFVVMADHGEGLGERSRVKPNARIASHTLGIHEHLVHVPLVVKAPGQVDSAVVSKPVTLAAFPDAVRRTIEGHPDPEFCVDRPVVTAACHGRLYDYVFTTGKWRVSDYVDELDTSLFSGTARAVYEQCTDDIYKYITWGDDSGTIRIRPGDESKRVADGGETELNAVFDAFDSKAVRDTYDTVENIEEDVLETLRDLGYK